MNIRPVHSERYLQSLGCEIINIRDVKDFDKYDIVIDFMTYNVEFKEEYDYVEGFGYIEHKISSKYRIPIKPTEDDIDSDIITFLDRRGLLGSGKNKIVVKYGIKHIDNADLYIGYGAFSKFQNFKSTFKDPFNIYRHVIYISLILAFRKDLSNIEMFPTWFLVPIDKYLVYRFGPVSSDIFKLGISPTSISLTIDNVYMKILTCYGKFPFSIQCVGSFEDVSSKLSLAYSIVSTCIEDPIIKLLSIPSIPESENLRSWVDMFIECILRESYWIYYIKR